MNDFILKDRTLLNTRPTHQAKPLSDWIFAQGGKVISFPTIAIELLIDNDDLITTIDNINHYDIAVFISANAVFAATKCHLTLPKRMTIIAIGPGTQQAIQQHLHAQALIPDQFNTEGILQMPELALPNNKKIIIFSGENNRVQLSQTLAQRGAIVHELKCYRRSVPNVDVVQILPSLLRVPIDLIISTSQESLQNLYKMLNPVAGDWLADIPLLVINQEMAVLAQHLSLKQPPIIAQNASDQAIKEALIQWASPQFSH